MKLYYIVKNLDKIPSCAYNIQSLKKLGYEVICVLGASTDGINKNFREDGIETHIMSADSEKSGKKSSVSYIMRFRKFVKKTIGNAVCRDDVIFLGTADTAMAVWGMFPDIKKVICIKELYDNDKLYRRFLVKLCRKADAVVACEINRARMMQFEWGLKKRPYVIPNKPYFHPRQKNCLPTTEQTSAIIEKIKDKPCIVYQANHIRFAQELKALAVALKSLPVNYELVLIGTVDNPGDIEALKKIYPNITTTGYIFSPLHIEITSYAKIGITVYSENSLNNLFCAPNKIYEYAGYSVPTLANDVPGLVETVGLTGAGECVDWSDPSKIAEAIMRIEQNYEEYSENARLLFESTDILSKLDSIVKAVTGKED